VGYLYILENRSSGRYYVGSTNDLPRRLAEHPRDHTPSTRGRGLWVMAHQESFPTLREARRQEAEIKGWMSARLLRELAEGAKG
jgi:putative endonuclease